MTERVDILTPSGRMVQGDPFTASSTGYQGKPLLDKHNQPRSEFFFAIAIPKTDPGWPAFWQTLQGVATAGFPGGQSAQADFSWKVKDGDDPKYAGREGFAGHYVVGCSTGFAIKVYTSGGAQQIVDPAQLKRGYFIRAYVSVRPNGEPTKPGIFINPSMIELVGYGEEIQGGPDGAQVFGAAPAALPAGASATPVAGAPLAASGGPGGPGGPAAPPAGPGPAAAGPPAAGTLPPGPAGPPAGVTSAPDFLTPPAPATAPAAPPVAPVKQMTAKAAGATYESFIAANWTDAQLIAEGYLIGGVPF